MTPDATPTPGLVSVIIPNFDRAGLLPQTLRSVQDQTYPDLEVIVVDDGSTDDSPQIVEASALADPRLRLVNRAEHTASRGAQVCRNLGSRLARGEFLLFLDSDDLLAAYCLEQRVRRLAEEARLDFVVGQCEQFAETPGDLRRPWSTWREGQDDLDEFLANRIPWQTSGPLWRRTALARIGPWDEDLIHVGHDHEFHVRALCRGAAYDKIPRVDYYWRTPRADSLSSLESFKRHHAEGGMLKAYQAMARTVVASGCGTPARAATLADQALRLAISCRLWGGAFTTAVSGVRTARANGWLPAGQAHEISLALRFWFRILGRVPAMSWLNHRFPEGRG